MNLLKSLLIVMSGTKHCVSLSPAGPLELQSASTNRVLGGGVCEALPPTPSALLCFDFSLRLKAIGCSRARLPAGLTSRRGALFSRRLAERGENFQTLSSRILPCTARRREEGTQPTGWGGERASSPTTQIAQKNSTAGELKAWGVVLRTPRLRGRDFSKRGEAQGGGWGLAEGLVPARLLGSPHISHISYLRGS